MALVTSALLSLPRLHADIPLAPVIDEGEDSAPIMAGGLVHAGILKARHLDTAPDLRTAMDRAVDEWLSPYHAQLEIFATVSCGYTPELKFEGDHEFAPQNFRMRKPAAFLVSNDDVARESRYIETTATALQKKAPNLGRDLLHILNVASSHGLGLYDPAAAYAEAQYHFWQGETDLSLVADNFRDPKEEDALRKAGKPVPTDEEILRDSGIPLPEDFFSIYPKWAADLPPGAWSPVRLPSFPTLRGKWGPAMQAANDLGDHLRMVRRRWLTANDREDWLYPNDARRINVIGDIVSCPILLRWNYEDWHVRLLDDSFNVISQEGVTDYLTTGAVCFDPRDSEDCRDARARFEALLTTGILTDRLLQLTTTPDRDDG